VTITDWWDGARKRYLRFGNLRAEAARRSRISSFSDDEKIAIQKFVTNLEN
jgi:hypothetical protein